MTLSAVILATILLGFAPPLLWLWFWLKESTHSEPKSEIALVFSFGMAVVLFAFIVESIFSKFNTSFQNIFIYSQKSFYLFNVIGFAFIEEVAKTSAAYFTALRSKYFNEPVDAMIYVIAASLGFAALENALFISQSAAVTLTQTLVVSSFRFANAVLIHSSTGAIIGAAFAFSFCNRNRRAIELGIALFAATILHGTYNYYIIGSNANPNTQNQLIATAIVGTASIIALILFERARKLRIQCV